MVTTGAVRRPNLVRISPPTKQHPVFFTGRMPFLSASQPANGVKALKGKRESYSFHNNNYYYYVAASMGRRH